jgi:hypothetical protein
MNVLADAFVALLLTFVALELHRTSKRAKKCDGDVVLVELCGGLATVVVMVLWFHVFVQILY